jgi:hypothetical protein
LASLAVLLVAVAGVFVYASPMGFPAALRTAIQNRDTIRLEQLIDFPAVREGLKSDLKAQVSAVIARPAGAGGAPADTTLAGAILGLTQGQPGGVDQMVDQTVTPQGLEQVVVDQPTPADAGGQGAQLFDGLFPKDRAGLRFRVDRHYLAFGRFRYTLTSTAGKSFVDVDLQRQGLFGWRVMRVTANLDLASLHIAAAPPPAPPPPAPGNAVQAPSSAPPAAAVADTLPTVVGQCADTTVKDVSTRLDGMPDSGSAISFTNGGYQVSYDQIPGVDQSRAGDPVNLCLVAVPDDCPAGDDRGKTYKAINLRTGETWTLPDSEHMCGGA